MSVWNGFKKNGWEELEKLRTDSSFQEFCCKGECGTLLFGSPKHLVYWYLRSCVGPSLGSRLFLGPHLTTLFQFQA